MKLPERKERVKRKKNGLSAFRREHVQYTNHTQSTKRFEIWINHKSRLNCELLMRRSIGHRCSTAKPKGEGTLGVPD